MLEKDPAMMIPGPRLPEMREMFLIKALQHAYDQGDDAISQRLEVELSDLLCEQKQLSEQ